MQMSDYEFNELFSMLKEEFGIDMSKKKEIMASRLEPYLRIKGIENFTEFIHAIKNDDTGQNKIEFANLLTTNHTFFMRENEHFDFLKEVILPELRIKCNNDKDIHIWSAASSTGQEAYGIAMLLLDFFGIEQDLWDTKVLATDISTKVLEVGIKGIYSKEAMDSVSDTWKQRYFKLEEDGMYHAKDIIKNQVLFRRFNLMEDFHFKKKMHVIFLRNVMIYFDNETRQKLINKMYEVLDEDGYLFIGQTETLDRIDVPFTLIKPSIYKKEKIVKSVRKNA